MGANCLTRFTSRVRIETSSDTTRFKETRWRLTRFTSRVRIETASTPRTAVSQARRLTRLTSRVRIETSRTFALDRSKPRLTRLTSRVRIETTVKNCLTVALTVLSRVWVETVVK